MFILALSQAANDPKVRMCGGEDQIEESKYSALKSLVDAHGGRDIDEIIDPFTSIVRSFICCSDIKRQGDSDIGCSINSGHVSICFIKTWLKLWFYLSSFSSKPVPTSKREMSVKNHISQKRPGRIVLQNAEMTLLGSGNGARRVFAEWVHFLTVKLGFFVGSLIFIDPFYGINTYCYITSSGFCFEAFSDHPKEANQNDYIKLIGWSLMWCFQAELYHETWLYNLRCDPIFLCRNANLFV